MLYVVAYDIANDKRRKKVSEHLDKYGVRVNYSVYEIELNKTKFKTLLGELEAKKLIHKEYDSIRFYHICENCLPKSFELSIKPDPFQAKEMFI
ncbi:CRISPR-associated endonuclease Cas2 [bacterium]|nr:CRISPR-associated endonuclease Cas2 [bacterium]